MTTFKKICLLLFITVTPLIFISCSDDGPVQTEENQLELDSELIGTWKGIGVVPRTFSFKQINETEGSGVKISEDYYGNCQNINADYSDRRDFKWTQTKKTSKEWSSFYYAETASLECGGAQRNSRLFYERFYKIEGDTLYLGTQDYQIYVKSE